MLKKTLYLAGLFFVFATAQIQANSWKSIGLDSLKINCMYTTGNHIFAGTENGLYIYGDISQKWIKLAGVPNLPISDIIAGNGSEIILSANAGGSNSDGIYVGLDIMDGEPYYEFQLLEYEMFVENIGYYNDTLLFGGKNNLLSAIRLPIKSLWPQFSDPKKINIPQNAFGVEQPYCSEIKYSTLTNSFFVAGYDKSPIPSEGMLISGTSEKLTPYYEKSSTSFVEIFVGFIGGNSMYVGGIDKVYKFSSDTLIIETPNNSKVNHISKTDKGEMTIGGSGYICISTDDGVYLTNDDKTWKEIGNIPQKPTMTIEVISNSESESVTTLISATDKGVYQYTFGESGTINNSKINLNSSNFIKFKNEIINFSYPNNLNKNISLNLFSISGKKIKSLNFKNQNSIKLNLNSLNISSGIYLIRFSVGNELFAKSFNYLR